MEQGQESLELKIALELSKKTYEEEQIRRAQSDYDLIMLEDPDSIRRNEQIDQIKKLSLSSSAHTQLSAISTKSLSLCHPHPSSSNVTNFIASTPQATSLNSMPNSIHNSPMIQQFPSNLTPFQIAFAPSSPPCERAPILVQMRQPPKNGDLIDLNHSPRTASISIEELDPLFNKRKTVSISTTDARTSSSPPKTTIPEYQNCQPTSSKTLPNTIVAVKTNSKNNLNDKSIFSRQYSITVADLVICKAKCDAIRQQELLREKCQTFFVPGEKDVLFYSPLVDYFTTTADTIKLVVYKDHSWRRDLPDDQNSVEFTCDVRSTGEEILMDVLLRFLPPEVITANDGTIPLDKYGLKLFGFDEFINAKAAIGKHPFVGRNLSLGKDIQLEIGTKKLTQPKLNRLEKTIIQSKIQDSILSRDDIEKLIDRFSKELEKCHKDYTDTKIRQSTLQIIKLICTLMKQVQPNDLAAALDLFQLSNTEDAFKLAEGNLLRAVHRLITMYCKSSLTNFSLESLNDLFKPLEQRDLRHMEDNLLISIESLHNIPDPWVTSYASFYIQVHVMHGLKSFGLFTETPKKIVKKHQFVTCPLQSWADFNVQLLSLPRETQICILLYGIPKVDENGEAPGTSANFNDLRQRSSHELASASIPLFNDEGFLLQGPIMLPLSLTQDRGAHPWGPRPLIRNSTDPILVVTLVEYPFDIIFPKKIPSTICQKREFSSLSVDQQGELLDIIESKSGNTNDLQEDDKKTLWSNRGALTHLPESLPLVLGSSIAWDWANLGNIYPLLDEWTELPPIFAVELLLPYFQDIKVREKAINYIRKAPSDFLFNLLPQLVEALRFETFENSNLALFLLETAAKDRRFSIELYWQLQHRIESATNSSYGARCQLLQNELLNIKIAHFQDEITIQHKFLNEIDKVAREMKEVPENKMMATLHTFLYDINDRVMSTNVRVPLNPSFLCTGISVKDCGYFNSLTKPIRLRFTGVRTNFDVIYKIGDDLRQDAIVLQIVRLMNDIWLNEQLDLRMITFRCLPTGIKKGMIELVPDCRPLCEIHSSQGATGVFKDDILNNWLIKNNPSEFQYKAALENFQRSCAGWCVATYVLGIGDRHNDNILVTTSGHVFHIDFGKYMGDWQMAAGFKRDRVPFVLTQDMAYVINGGTQTTTEMFQKFIDNCCKAFNLLRQNCSLMVNIMRFMACSDIPGMNQDAVAFVQGNLMLNLNETEATTQFTRMIEESLRSKFPRWNFFAHTLVQIKNSSSIISKLGGSFDDCDPNKLSFTSEICTMKDDGRIREANVVSFEKWFMPNKVYMYKIEVKREHQAVVSIIYRSYAEFSELYIKLCRKFTHRALPPLTSLSMGLGRSNVRTMATRRQIQLQVFLHRLFELVDEICTCDLIYTFFHTIYRDNDPEVARTRNGVDVNAFSNEISYPRILLKLTLESTKPVLHIFMGHAQNLPLVGNEQAPDSYVKTYIQPDRDRSTKRKSGVVRNNQNPTYNEEIIYTFGSEEYMLSKTLQVSIWHSGSSIVGDNFPLCQTSIDLDKLLQVKNDKKGNRILENWFNLYHQRN